MIKTTVRTARKAHECNRCRRPIEVGQLYASSVVTPYEREVNSDNPHWWRIAECAPCCAECGRPIEEAR